MRVDDNLSWAYPTGLLTLSVDNEASPRHWDSPFHLAVGVHGSFGSCLFIVHIQTLVPPWPFTIVAHLISRVDRHLVFQRGVVSNKFTRWRINLGIFKKENKVHFVAYLVVVPALQKKTCFYLHRSCIGIVTKLNCQFCLDFFAITKSSRVIMEIHHNKLSFVSLFQIIRMWQVPIILVFYQNVRSWHNSHIKLKIA